MAAFLAEFQHRLEIHMLDEIKYNNEVRAAAMNRGLEEQDVFYALATASTGVAVRMMDDEAVRHEAEIEYQATKHWAEVAEQATQYRSQVDELLSQVETLTASRDAALEREARLRAELDAQLLVAEKELEASADIMMTMALSGL